MKFIPPADLSDYVKATRYCDSDSDEVKNKAREITGHSDSPEKAALSIFSYVRDSFKFGLTPVNLKASEVLRGDLGWCVTKTNLQIALLRATGIPARYHQVVLTKKSLKGIVSRLFYMAIDEPIWYHPWCECFIHGRWVACDLFIDSVTYRGAIEEGYFNTSYFPTVEWDGENDLILVNHWLLEDRGTHINYDPVIEKVAAELKRKPELLIKWLVNSSNHHTASLRKPL